MSKFKKGTLVLVNKLGITMFDQNLYIGEVVSYKTLERTEGIFRKKTRTIEGYDVLLPDGSIYFATDPKKLDVATVNKINKLKLVNEVL